MGPQEEGEEGEEKEKEKRMRNFLGPLVDDRGDLNIAGAVKGVREAIRDLLEISQEYPNILQTTNGATNFHGGPAGSLLAFTEYGKYKGVLQPAGHIEREGRIYFGGEVIFGRGLPKWETVPQIIKGRKEVKRISDTELLKYINQITVENGGSNNSISTCWILNIREVFLYERAKQGYPETNETERVMGKIKMYLQRIQKRNGGKKINKSEIKRQAIKQQFIKILKLRLQEWREKAQKEEIGHNWISVWLVNIIQVISKRIVELEKLSDEEIELLTSDFGVIFGIRPTRKGSTKRAFHDIPGEMYIEGEILPEELRCIIVPQEYVDYVREIVQKSHNRDVKVVPRNLVFAR